MQACLPNLQPCSTLDGTDQLCCSGFCDIPVGVLGICKASTTVRGAPRGMPGASCVAHACRGPRILIT